MIEDIERKELDTPPEQGWKDRLIEEYLYVDSKCGRLHRFIEWSEEFARMDSDRQGLLMRQLEVMKEYQKVLGERVVLEGLWGEVSNLLQ